MTDYTPDTQDIIAWALAENQAAIDAYNAERLKPRSNESDTRIAIYLGKHLAMYKLLYYLGVRNFPEITD